MNINTLLPEVIRLISDLIDFRSVVSLTLVDKILYGLSLYSINNTHKGVRRLVLTNCLLSIPISVRELVIFPPKDEELLMFKQDLKYLSNLEYLRMDRISYMADFFILSTSKASSWPPNLKSIELTDSVVLWENIYSLTKLESLIVNKCETGLDIRKLNHVNNVVIDGIKMNTTSDDSHYKVRGYSTEYGNAKDRRDIRRKYEFGEDLCEQIYKSGKNKGQPCRNKAKYSTSVDSKVMYLCGVHSKGLEREFIYNLID